MKLLRPLTKYLVIFSLVSCVAPQLEPKPDLYFTWFDEAAQEWIYCRKAPAQDASVYVDGVQCFPMEERMILVKPEELKRIQLYQKEVLNKCAKWK